MYTILAQHPIIILKLRDVGKAKPKMPVFVRLIYFLEAPYDVNASFPDHGGMDR
jgi:hypothetical protein